MTRLLLLALVGHLSLQGQTKADNKTFRVDDYPVTDNMLTCNDNYSACQLQYRGVVSLDKIWFGNRILNQTLVFELATDKFRMNIYNFYNDDIPFELINSVELNVENGDTASIKQKIKAFKGFVGMSKQIDKRYFVTRKKLGLGDSTERVSKIYGKPDGKTKSGNLEILEWDFQGDLYGDKIHREKANRKNKSPTEESFRHQLILFSKKGKIIALMFHNDIP